MRRFVLAALRRFALFAVPSVLEALPLSAAALDRHLIGLDRKARIVLGRNWPRWGHEP